MTYAKERWRALLEDVCLKLLPCQSSAEEKPMTVEKFQFTVRRYVDEWEKEKQPESNPVDCKWEPPPEGFVKINTDAAFHEATQTGAGVLFVETDPMTSTSRWPVPCVE
jgi:hypothetical protein